MSDALSIFRKEWVSFTGSDRGLFLVYAVLIAGWAVLMATLKTDSMLVAAIWFASFSVIAAATFSNNVFVSERISGSLEVLLTSGISRNGILFGKMSFVLFMTVMVGGVCMGLADILRPVFNPSAAPQAVDPGINGVAIYCGASFLSAASSAYFSVVLPNPRVLHFINLFMIMVFIFLYAALAAVYAIPIVALAGFMALGGIVFALLAVRQFDGERIIKPIIL